MRFFALLVTAVLLSPALAARVNLPGSTLSLELPRGFVPMDASMIALKYPRGTAPRYVYTTPDTRVNIAFDMRQAPLPAARLNEFGAYMKGLLSQQLKVLAWERSGPLRLNGRDWYELVFTFQAADQPVYDRMLFTSYEGRALVVTANATAKDLPAYKTALDTALSSIRY